MNGAPAGLKLANGIHYGNVVKFQNLVLEFMICDRNGWITMSNSGTHWDHFVLISGTHREGLVTFGDSISLRTLLIPSTSYLLLVLQNALRTPIAAISPTS